MTRLLLPFVLAALAYGYWKYLAKAPPELKQRRIQSLIGWAVFAITVAAAIRSGSLLWLLATAGVMGVMRILAQLGRHRGTGSTEEKAGPEWASSGQRPGTRGMSREEALQVLELGDNPSLETINKRYRDLMRSVHPDRGGSNYLAAKLNEAYQVLTGGKA